MRIAGEATADNGTSPWQSMQKRRGPAPSGRCRRQVDPTTCERDYTDDEIIFMKAMDQYKRDNRRPFPTWSEVLEVLYSLGYRKVAKSPRCPGLSGREEFAAKGVRAHTA